MECHSLQQAIRHVLSFYLHFRGKICSSNSVPLSSFYIKTCYWKFKDPGWPKDVWIDVFLAPICLILDMCLTDIIVKPCVKIFLLVKLNFHAAFLSKNIYFDRVISNLSNARQIFNI